MNKECDGSCPGQSECSCWFWNAVKKAAAEVATWPQYKQAGVVTVRA